MSYDSIKAKTLLVAKTMGIIFLVIMFFLLLKVINNDSCGRESSSEYRGGATQLAFTMTSEDTLFLNNPYDYNKKGLTYKACLTLNSSNPVSVKLVDYENNVLAGTIINGTIYECFYLENFNPETSKIGFVCEDCTASNNLSFYEEVLGTNTERTIITSGVISSFSDKPIDLTLNTYVNCWEGIRTWSVWYLTLIVFMAVIWLLIVGFKKAEEVLFKE